MTFKESHRLLLLTTVDNRRGPRGKMEFKKFLLFGDSITEFAFNSRANGDSLDQFALGAALCNAYTRKLDILQRGFSGYNSRWGLKILPEVLKNEENIVLSTIFFGSNDACLGGHQRVPLEEYVSNTRKMISLLKSKDIKPILVGPALVDQQKFEAPRQDEVAKGYIRTNESFQNYSKALQKLSKEENLPFVDLNTTFRQEAGENWRVLLVDGLHFSGKGYEIFFQQLMKTIEEFYPELAPENIPTKLPAWREVAEDGSNLF